MSTFFSKENPFTANEDSENAVVRLKQQNAKANANSNSNTSGNGNRRIGRIPLGGKLNNSATPSLQKSQSTLHANQVPSQRKKVLLPKAPTLLKANSSLGFFHQKPQLSPKKSKTYQIAKPKLELDFNISNLFHHRHANRRKQLSDYKFDSDSLIKKSRQSQRSSYLVSKLSDTLSSKTRSLHSSHIPPSVIAKEPVKGESQPQATNRLSSLQESLIASLSEDPNSVETLPERSTLVSTSANIPSGMQKFAKDDLEFLSKSNRLALTKENEYEYSDIHDIESNLKMKEIDLENPINFGFSEIAEEDVNDEEDATHLKGVGLSVDELNDLLDF